MGKNTYGCGQVIFREGDPGDSMFEVYTGKVGVYANYGTADEKLLTDHGRKLRRLFPGESFQSPDGHADAEP